MSDRRHFLATASAFLLLAGCGPARQSGSGRVSGGAQSAPAVPVLRFQDWAAWVNRQGSPDSMHVSGSIQLPSPGYVARLERLDDLGASRETMVFDLIIEPQPGDWPQQTSWRDVTYTIDDYGGDHTNVAVLYRGTRLTDTAGNALQNIWIGEVR
jgi:hypothetical protein